MFLLLIFILFIIFVISYFTKNILETLLLFFVLFILTIIVECLNKFFGLDISLFDIFIFISILLLLSEIYTWYSQCELRRLNKETEKIINSEEYKSAIRYLENNQDKLDKLNK